MRTATALRWMLRESRGARGRLAYLVACLAVGVAAVVGTASLAESVREATRQRSREFLGADLTVDAKGPLPAGLDGVLASIPGAERSDVFETTSMARAASDASGDGPVRVVRVHAVRGRWPLYGEVATDPPGGLAAHLAPDRVVAPRDLLDALGARVGDEILVGGGRFRVAATVVREPPSFGFSSLLGSRIYLSDESLRATQILGFGTRVTRRAFVRMPGGSGDAALADMRRRIQAVPDGAHLDVDLHTEGGPGRGRTMARVESFLGLTSLLALVVGGIGVALIVRAWLAGRTQAVAVMRCLGVRPAEILAITLGNVAILAAAGSAAGVAAGLAVPAVADALVPDLVPGGLPWVLPIGAVARGMVLGIGVAVAFSLPPLTAIWRIPPARVLRATAAPVPAPRSVTVLSALAVVGGLAVASWIQSPRVVWALTFTGGLVVLAALLAAAARALIAASRRIPRRRFHHAVAHALAALGRPGAGTGTAVVALGLGTLVVTATWIVQSRFREALLAQIPPNAPSVYLVDIRPGQAEGVRAALARSGADRADEVPVATARIVAIDGRPVEVVGAPDDWRARRIARETRIASRAELPPDNKVVAGALWGDPARAEASLEERHASELGIRVGTSLTLDVRDRRVDVRVTSLRSVDWQSLSMNFLVLVEPGVLDPAATLRIASARVPPDAEARLLADVSREFPNVTAIRVGAVLEQVTNLVMRAATGVRALGAFSAAAGVLVLAGAAAATALHRRREVALLKVLGVTRAGVVTLLALEYGVAGALAGLIGSCGAVALAGGFLTYVADVDLGPPLAAIPVATVLCAVATAACGVAASAHALRARPVEVLR